MKGGLGQLEGGLPIVLGYPLVAFEACLSSGSSSPRTLKLDGISASGEGNSASGELQLVHAERLAVKNHEMHEVSCDIVWVSCLQVSLT